MMVGHCRVRPAPALLWLGRCVKMDYDVLSVLPKIKEQKTKEWPWERRDLCTNLKAQNCALSHFSQCSASCGRGFKDRNVTCVSEPHQPITEENCMHLPFPKRQKRCRGGRCPKWKTASWGEVKPYSYTTIQAFFLTINSYTTLQITRQSTAISCPVPGSQNQDSF